MTKKRLGKTITWGTRRKSYKKKKTKNAGLTRLYYFGISTKKQDPQGEKPQGTRRNPIGETHREAQWKQLETNVLAQDPEGPGLKHPQ